MALSAWGRPEAAVRRLGGVIFVTGASGRMGGAVLRHAAGWMRTRAGTRSGRDVTGADETRRFDIDDASTFGPALDGCGALFLMRPPTTTARGPFDRLMRAAARAGVGHVACASVWGAERSRVLPHRHMEAAVRAGGIGHTFLRPADFMQNLADIHAEAIAGQGEIAVPAGGGRSAFLDADDVGAATLAALSDPAAHAGRGYGLTGPQALDFDDVARIVGRALGRAVRYRSVSTPRFVIEQVRAGRPLPLVLVMSLVYGAQRFGRAAPVSSDFERLTGRAPGSLAEYVERERARFTSP